MSCSILLSLYAREKPTFLRDCLQSLARQTRPAAEIILVEDGAITEELRAVIDSFAATLPIKPVRLPVNVGLGRALNAGLSHCSHMLVARMDTDDVARPTRLEKQLAYMEARPEIAVCGTWVVEKDAAMQHATFLKKLPLEHVAMAAFAKNRNPLCHPACIFRRDAVLSVGGYPAVFPEDYALWSLMIVRGFRLGNLPEVLLDMRTGDDFIERRGFDFLKREISLVKFQRSIGFFTFFEAARFFAVRVALRLPPAWLRSLLYKYTR